MSMADEINHNHPGNRACDFVTNTCYVLSFFKRAIKVYANINNDLSEVMRCSLVQVIDVIVGKNKNVVVIVGNYNGRLTC